MRPIPLLLAMLMVTCVTDRARAQDPLPLHLTTSLGVFQYDLSRSGVAPMVALRATVPSSSVLVVEGGVVAARPQQQVGGSTLFLAPEAQLQLVLPFERILPYMGLGAGAVVDFRGEGSGGTYANFSVTGSFGVRAWILDRGGLQAEFRARGMGLDFEGTSSEYTAGMIWRL